MPAVIKPTVSLGHIKEWVEGTFQTVECPFIELCCHLKILTHFAKVRQLNECIYMIGMLINYCLKQQIPNNGQKSENINFSHQSNKSFSCPLPAHFTNLLCRVFLKKLIVTNLVKTPHYYGIQGFFYCICKSQPLDTNLNQFNPVHNLTYHFSKIHFNVNIPSMLRSHKWSLTFRFTSSP